MLIVQGDLDLITLQSDEVFVALRRLGKEVVYDAEHLFDGWRLDPAYALATLGAAADAGADWIVLCDTNGGSLPETVREVVGCIRERIRTPLGIHPHNDSGLAVANALAAVQAGCGQVQGTIKWTIRKL